MKGTGGVSVLFAFNKDQLMVELDFDSVFVTSLFPYVVQMVKIGFTESKWFIIL